MGIYDNGNILGVRIYNFNNDDIANILFEKTYNEIMTDEEKKEAYLFYTELNNEIMSYEENKKGHLLYTELYNNNEIRFQYYTECSSTYGQGTFKMWRPISLKLFLEKFEV